MTAKFSQVHDHSKEERRKTLQQMVTFLCVRGLRKIQYKKMKTVTVIFSSTAVKSDARCVFSHKFNSFASRQIFYIYSSH